MSKSEEHQIFVADSDGKLLFDFYSASIPPNDALFAHLLGGESKHYRVLSQEWVFTPQSPREPNSQADVAHVTLTVVELP